MNWLKKTLNFGQKIKRFLKKRPSRKDMEESDWTSCCKGPILKKDLENNLWVCPDCNKHHRINPKQRFDLLFGKQNYQVLKSTASFSFDRYICGEYNSLSRALGLDLNNQPARDARASARLTERNNNELSRIFTNDLALLNEGTQYRNLPQNLVAGGITRRLVSPTHYFLVYNFLEHL